MTFKAVLQDRPSLPTHIYFFQLPTTDAASRFQMLLPHPCSLPQSAPQGQLREAPRRCMWMGRKMERAEELQGLSYSLPRRLRSVVSTALRLRSDNNHYNNKGFGCRGDPDDSTLSHKITTVVGSRLCAPPTPHPQAKSPF